MEPQQLAHFRLEHDTLIKNLKQLLEAPPDLVSIPLGRFAFQQAEVSSNSKIITALGESLFIETDVPDAIAVVERRIAFVEAAVQELQRKQDLIPIFGPDGEAINEEGEKFMEIQGTGNFHLELETAKIVLPEQPVVAPIRADTKVIDPEDLLLLERIRNLELMEEDSLRSHSSDTRSNFLDAENSGASFLSVDKSSDSMASSSSPGHKRSSLKSPAPTRLTPLKKVNFPSEDSLRQPSPPPEQRVGPPRKAGVAAPAATTSKTSSSGSAGSARSSTSSRTSITSRATTMKTKVVERPEEPDAEDADAATEDMELEMLGRDVRLAYHFKRQQLIATGLMKPDRTMRTDEDDADDRQFEEMVRQSESEDSAAERGSGSVSFAPQPSSNIVQKKKPPLSAYHRFY